MQRELKPRGAACREVSATEFKKSFGQTLEQAFRGERVRITRHGRIDERVIIIREAELAGLEARAASPLDGLRAEFDRMVAAMGTPVGRRAAAKVGSASMKEMGKAAVKGSRKGG